MATLSSRGTAAPLTTPRPVALGGVGAMVLRAHWRAAVICVYALSVVLVEILHRPWFDEAQSWLLARDASIPDLFTQRLRYEGSPGLWHLLLLAPARLGLPYRTVSVIGLLAAVTGVVILVRRSPLPWVLTALVPFTYFVLYQYGVVARSYCLLPLLLALLAAGHRGKLDHPWRFAVLLALLANVSLHGLIIAVSLEAIHLADLRRAWVSLSPGVRRAHIRGLVLVVVAAAAVIAQVWPVADIEGGGSWHLNPVTLAQRVGPVGDALPLPLLTLAATGISMWWLRRRRCLLLFVLPVTGLMLLFTVRYFSPWHAGTLVLVWLYAMWVACTEESQSPRASVAPPLAVTAAAAVALAAQVAWTARSVGYELGHAYSGSGAAAAYISEHHLTAARIDAVGKWSVAVLPYFGSNIFHDYNGGGGPAYYPWSKSHYPLLYGWHAVFADDPDYILLAVKSPRRSNLPCLPGYDEVAVFPGGIDIGGRVYESESFALYARSNDAVPDVPIMHACGSA